MDAALEQRIDLWRSFVARRPAIATRDVAELEAHLRDQIDALTASGLSADEAFLVAVSRLGRIDELSREFAREHSDRLWKQLTAGDEDAARRRDRSLWLAIGLAVAAAVVVKIPALFGREFFADGFFLRNAALFLLPALAVYLLVVRRASVATIVAVAVPFVALGVVLNVYPFTSGSATEPLAAAAAFVALWLVVGIAYAAGDWRSVRARMDFVRFTGEWFVYLVLIALGGGVLTALTVGVFGAVGVDAAPFVVQWLVPCGLVGAVVIAGWLVEAKQSVIENIAPVLTKVFTPLFTALLLALIAAGILQGNVVEPPPGTEVFGQNDLMVLFDVVLVVVLALLLYAISAREPEASASWFEGMQLVLVVAALVVDGFVLAAMLGRIDAYGASPNKLASLGLNVILLANLAGAAWLQWRFVRRRGTFAAVERWQTSFLPVYFAWCSIVVVVFPPVFAFA